jgi:hypothetical protein
MTDFEKDETGENAEETGTSSPENSSDSAQDRLTGRRRFLAGGLAAAPVILTLSNRPALATGGRVCTPSAYVSVAVGTSLTGPQRCYGRSPGYWKNHCPSSGSMKFYDVFGALWRDNSGIMWGNPGSDVSPHVQLCEVVDMYQNVLELGGDNDQYEFGAHVIAAYFNATIEPDGDYPMTPSTVIDMAYQVMVYGQYNVGNGVYWGPQQVVSFIQGTFDEN